MSESGTTDMVLWKPDIFSARECRWNVRKMQSMARLRAWPGLRLAARIGLTVRYWVPSPVSSKRPRLAPHGQRGFSLWAAARVAGLFCNER